jgi:hypothetical protein
MSETACACKQAEGGALRRKAPAALNIRLPFDAANLEFTNFEQEPSMSRIVRFHRIGGPEILQIDELDIGLLKAGEIRLRVRAIGLSRAEAMFRSGAYLETPSLPV